ncbi:MAG: type II toxin-antitoxin system RelE/ParE family toxin [Nitrospira sp.]|nr:type II toxin-antitoxin system RelE/ParE family toxin [Nitrospira sp.]
MRHEIILAPEAIEQFQRLRAQVRASVRDAIETHLRREPTKGSKSRIKRLRGMKRPQYRLRIDEIRVYYDVTEDTVEVLAIIDKSEASSWLEGTGKRS